MRLIGEILSWGVALVLYWIQLLIIFGVPVWLVWTLLNG